MSAELDRIYDKMDDMQKELSTEIKSGVKVFTDYISKKNEDEKEFIKEFTKYQVKTDKNETDMSDMEKKTEDKKKWWDNVIVKLAFLFASPLLGFLAGMYSSLKNIK